MEFIQNQTTGIKNLLSSDFFEIDIILPSKENQKEIARNYISQIDNSLITIQKAYSDLYKSRVDIQNNIF